MNFTLSDEILKTAERRASLTGYESAREYVESLIVENEPSIEEDEELIASLREAQDEADAGLGRPFDEVMEELAIKHGLPWPIRP